ncbi:MAG: hypothetical protein AAFO07_10080 [Bacteroidota bacterium]
MKQVFTYLTVLSFISLCGFVRAQVPTDGLVGYWNFNGNYEDSSGNENHASNTGTTLSFDRFGNEVSSVRFDDFGDYLEIINSASISLDGLTDDYTISLWYNSTDPITSGNASAYVFNKWDGRRETPAPYAMLIFDTDTLKCWIDAVTNISDVSVLGLMMGIGTILLM